MFHPVLRVPFHPPKSRSVPRDPIPIPQNVSARTFGIHVTRMGSKTPVSTCLGPRILCGAKARRRKATICDGAPTLKVVGGPLQGGNLLGLTGPEGPQI